MIYSNILFQLFSSMYKRIISVVLKLGGTHCKHTNNKFLIFTFKLNLKFRNYPNQNIVTKSNNNNNNKSWIFTKSKKTYL